MEETNEEGLDGQLEQIRELVGKYLGIYRVVRNRAHSDEVAVYICNNIAKDLRAERIGKEIEQRQQSRQALFQERAKTVRNADAPATERQIHLLVKLGLEHMPENLTRGKASVLIDELRQKERTAA